MKIERMSQDDLNGVIRLATQLGYPNSLRDIEARFIKIQKKSKYALFVAKSDSGGVLGWIQVNAEPVSLLVGARADIAALVVDEKQRNQGVGKALVVRAETWARENRLLLVRVRSNVKREGAHRFYQREGYTLSKTANMFVKVLTEQTAQLDGRNSV